MKRIYWLSAAPDTGHWPKVTLLEAKGFKVQFFPSIDELKTALARQRVALIIVGDEGPENAVLHCIHALARMPEVQGAKLVFSQSRPNRSLQRIVAGEAYRDIIPISTPEQQWLHRYLYAVGASHQAPAIPPVGLSCRFPARAGFPCRIVWMEGEMLWLESRLFPNPRQELQLAGALPKATGEKKLTVEVERIERRGLHFRFSVAILCRLVTPLTTAQRQNLEWQLKNEDLGAKLRTFIAVKSTGLRTQLIDHLSKGPFDIRTALHRKSLVEDPKYFQPQIVLVEQSLTSGEDGQRFFAMVKNLPIDATIVLIGPEAPDPLLNEQLGGRTLQHWSKIPGDLSTQLEQGLKNLRSSQPHQLGRWYLPSHHSFSYAEIQLKGQFSRVYAGGVEMRLPCAVGLYGMVRLDADIFRASAGRTLYGKIIATFDSATPPRELPYVMQLWLSDLDESEGQKLGQGLLHSLSHAWPGTNPPQLETRELSPEDHQPDAVDPTEPVEPPPAIDWDKAAEEPEPLPAEEPATAEQMQVPPLHKIQWDLAADYPDVVDTYKKPRRRKRESKPLFTIENFKHLVVFIGVSLLTALFVGAMMWFVAPEFERSGKVYTESLINFKNANKKPKGDTEE